MLRVQNPGAHPITDLLIAIVLLQRRAQLTNQAMQLCEKKIRQLSQIGKLTRVVPTAGTGELPEWSAARGFGWANNLNY